jgi:toxin ParE1/3/4
MRLSCRITPQATQDLETIADYLATVSQMDRAEKFLSDIDTQFLYIAQFPRIGRSREELYPNLRSLPHKQYVIFYCLLDDSIEIFRVVSGYQDVTDLFRDDEQ